MLRTVLIIFLMWSGLAYVPELSFNNEKQAIQRVITQKETAVNQRNKSLFLSLAHPRNNMYIQEQKRWFDDAVHYMDTNSFRLNLLSMHKEGKDTIRVLVSQEYTRKGKVFRVQLPLRFQKTTKGWKDADIAFRQYTNGIFVVYYTDEAIQRQAKTALQSIQSATAEFRKRYNWNPAKIEVKLYHQPEVFRQSVKPSLPSWAGGWHESKQAIKFIGGLVDDSAFLQGIVHELTHQMVSELTNDNAAYWLQEGAAMYYERHLWGKCIQTLDRGSLFSLSQLEGMNLENLSDREANRYYVSCYYIFKQLIQKYGERRIEKMLCCLRGYPEIDLDSVQKMQIINERTRKAVKAALGDVGKMSRN